MRRKKSTWGEQKIIIPKFWHLALRLALPNANLKFEASNSHIFWSAICKEALSCILFDEKWTVILKLFLHSNNLSVLSLSNPLLKGYLHYKTIFCHKVALDAQLMNFFIWSKNKILFSRYLDFCVFVKSTNIKICNQGFIFGVVNGEFRRGSRWDSPEFTGAYLKKKNQKIT